MSVSRVNYEFQLRLSGLHWLRVEQRILRVLYQYCRGCVLVRETQRIRLERRTLL